MSLQGLITEIGVDARASAKVLRAASREKKDMALKTMARLLSHRKQEIIQANSEDVKRAQHAGLSQAMIDRLTVTETVIDAMVQGLEEVAALPDPVGEITKMWKRPNGLMVGKMRIPLGVIGFIYESRPNVTVDAAGLCLKSGNAVILRGGSEAINSNIALASILAQALEDAALPQKAVQVVPSTDREAVRLLLRMENYIDLVIPRGGEGLIRFVAENSRIPVLKHYKGVCHIYVDKAADLEMARQICFNAKVQRPGVCNAMETLLVHRAVASRFLPPMYERLKGAGVELRGCPKTLEILTDVAQATEQDWYAEYLDLVLAVKIVSSLDEAIEHIDKYGSNHTEAIVTNDYLRAHRFLAEVDSSVVLVNASTRFNDGGQLGLGAEIGINTSKLHAFGPMGLEELTTTKFVVFGSGQTRN